MTADQQLGANGIDADVLTETIISAVERQITRYFAAMSQQAESARQTAEAAHQALEEQIPIIGAAIDAQREANEAYQQALQSALEERLSEFANHQHWRLNELEDKIGELPAQLMEALPARASLERDTLSISAEDLLEIRQTVRDDMEHSFSTVHSRVEELIVAQRRADEQSTALVQHVNDTTAALAQRMDDGDQRITDAVDAALSSAQETFTGGLTEVEVQVNEQVSTLLQKLEAADTRVTDRMLALEARINEEQGTKIANLEATLGRIGSGFDDAMVAVNQRVLELENRLLGFGDQLRALTDAVGKIDQDGIEELKEQLSHAVGEAMLVRIELDRLVANMNEKFDKQSVRLGEIDAKVSDQMDVGTAVQLERLDELERAVAILDPARYSTDAPAVGAGAGAGAGANGATAPVIRHGLPTLTLNPRLPGADTHQDGASYEQDPTYSSH